MPRKRMIDPLIWSDEGFSELAPRQQVLYIGLISNADDEGRLKGSPTAIALMLPAVYRGVSTHEVAADLDAVLASMGRLVRYEVNAKAYLAFLNYGDWQRIDRPTESKLPPPPGLVESSPSPQRGLGLKLIEENRSQEKGRELSARARAEREGADPAPMAGHLPEPGGADANDTLGPRAAAKAEPVQEKTPEPMADGGHPPVAEPVRDDDAPPPSAAPPPSPVPKPCATPPGFACFWAAYPKHEDRRQAEEVWRRLKPDAALQAVILAAIEAQKGGRKWREGFVKQPARWLRDRNWEDEVAEEPGPRPAMTRKQANLAEAIRLGMGGAQ